MTKNESYSTTKADLLTDEILKSLDGLTSGEISRVLRTLIAGIISSATPSLPNQLKGLNLLKNEIEELLTKMDLQESDIHGTGDGGDFILIDDANNAGETGKGTHEKNSN